MTPPMDKESDIEFLDNLELWVIGSLVFKREHRERLFALARRGAAAGDLLEALRATLCFIENTESELGIKLSSGDTARAAITRFEALTTQEKQ